MGIYLAQKKLFSETGGFVLEVVPTHLPTLKKLFSAYHVPLFEIGRTTDDNHLHMLDAVNITIQAAKNAWENGLREKLL